MLNQQQLIGKILGCVPQPYADDLIGQVFPAAAPSPTESPAANDETVEPTNPMQAAEEAAATVATEAVVTKEATEETPIIEETPPAATAFQL